MILEVDMIGKIPITSYLGIPIGRVVMDGGVENGGVVTPEIMTTAVTEEWQSHRGMDGMSCSCFLFILIRYNIIF